MNKMVRSAHPSIFTLSEIVTIELNKTGREIQSLLEGLPVRRDHRHSITEKTAKLTALERKVSGGTMDPIVFLTKVASICKHYTFWQAKQIEREGLDSSQMLTDTSDVEIEQGKTT
jgi:hypothetical protein